MAPRSLTDYAAERPSQGWKVPMCCRLIPLDLLEEIEADHDSDSPHSFAFYARWLKDEHDIDIAGLAIRNHFDAGHREKRRG